MERDTAQGLTGLLGLVASALLLAGIGLTFTKNKDLARYVLPAALASGYVTNRLERKYVSPSISNYCPREISPLAKD